MHEYLLADLLHATTTERHHAAHQHHLARLARAARPAREPGPLSRLLAALFHRAPAEGVATVDLTHADPGPGSLRVERPLGGRGCRVIPGAGPPGSSATTARDSSWRRPTGSSRCR